MKPVQPAPIDAPALHPLVEKLYERVKLAPYFVRPQLEIVVHLLAPWIESTDARLAALEGPGRIKPATLGVLLAPVVESERRRPNICIDGRECTRGCTREWCEIEHELETSHCPGGNCSGD